MIWFGWVLWHINHCRLFYVKSSLYIYIRYIWFGLVGFYGISTIVGYLMPSPLYTHTFKELEVICGHISISIVSTQLNGFNNCYLTLISLFDINYLFAHNQVLQCNTNNLILGTHLKSFKYFYILLTIKSSCHLLNSPTVLFLTIQFNVSHLFAHSLIWFLCLMAYQPL